MKTRGVLILLLALSSAVLGGELAQSAGSSAGKPEEQARAFSIEDYFRVWRFDEVTISDKGQWVALVARRESLTRDADKKIVFIDTTAAQHRFKEIPPDLNDATNIAWIPGTQELSFISARSGVAQVYSYDAMSFAIRQRTASVDPVVEYRFAPNGEALAYTTRRVNTNVSSLYDKLRSATNGILIDTDAVGLSDFIDPTFSAAYNSYFASVSLWIAGSAAPARRVRSMGSVREFNWAPDSRRLSVVFLPTRPRTSFLLDALTSIAIVDAVTGEPTPLYESTLPSDDGAGIGYAGGEWVRRSDSILVRRTEFYDLWTSDRFPAWAVLPVGPKHVSTEFHDSGEAYEADFRPIDSETVLVENTVQGTRSLYEWSPSGPREIEIPGRVGRHNSRFAFSSDERFAAFVSESLTETPEVFLWNRASNSVAPLTNLNQSVARQQLPRARRVQWRGADGTRVSGWLLLPESRKAGATVPLVTLVHGGPTYTFPNSFAPFFALWPYPLEVYPSFGIAVFIPNYRGTGSFGRAFGMPSSIDGEPVMDVLTGIRFLIDSRIADPQRLALIGHSHGAWLGPTVLTRAKTLFRATSFAEGNANAIVNYELYSGALNREVHDSVYGASLYDDPARYINLSPDLHFSGVSSANLFEGGSESEALLMLGYGKASRRAGAATELVIYPRSSHSLTDADMKKESAQRNLDWMRYWLLDEQDGDARKKDQYERWQDLRKYQRKGTSLTRR